MFKDIIPVVAAIAAAIGGTGVGYLLKTWVVDRGKLKLDERRFMAEHAHRLQTRNDQLEGMRASEFHRRECCRLMLALLRDDQMGAWAAAERAAVEYLRREGFAQELEAMGYGEAK